MSNQQSSIQEFLENLEKFVNILSGAKNNMDGRVKLSEHGLKELLDSLNTPTDYLTAGVYWLYWCRQAWILGPCNSLEPTRRPVHLKY